MSHLAPQDEVSIPKLELMVAVLAVKLDMTVKEELRLDLRPSIFWTKSSIVLQSIRNDRKRFLMFVAGRLALICKHTCVASWKHVPSEQNLPDLLSRGATAKVLGETKMWFNGADVLSEEPAAWPKKYIDCEVQWRIQTRRLVGQSNKGLQKVFTCLNTPGSLRQSLGITQVVTCCSRRKWLFLLLELLNLSVIHHSFKSPFIINSQKFEARPKR